MSATLERNMKADTEAAIRLHGEPQLRDDELFQPPLARHKSEFLGQLRREERRANRSKAPLSIALFRFDSDDGDEASNYKALLAFLRNNIRETDILGCLDKNVFGVILPDTDASKTEEFKIRIVNGHSHGSFSMVTGTYPDRLFQDILSETEVHSEFYPLFVGDFTECNRFRYFWKRSIDIAGALVALLVFSPLMLVTALAIKINSRGPVMFKQIRIGRRGVRFVLYKFRSMFYDTDDSIHREYVGKLIEGNLDHANQGDKEKPLYKLKSDPRVTGVGRFIRRTSIDELPQLFNVLKGDMSLVGPRPPLPYEVEKYQAWHLARILRVRPGITGFWQVEGRSTTSFDDMVRLDIRYIRNWSLMLDVRILLKTVKVVLRSAGAV